ncbi:MAG: ribbon-helix-helix protein, CopG family [Planctomycetes bacterium]|nr:ribbon-helix-helix protein, CopG family [Planctomycetota bacterium]MCC7399720.1 ribbon-helix-helix protein, CopG family [Planctomycetota bacterium]
MNRIFGVTFRCDLVERDRIEHAARSAGMSTSEFIRRAALAADPKKLAANALQDTPRAPLRRARVATVQDIKPFRAPFVHGLEGLGYERVVQHAARQMRMDQCSVAMLLTHVVDAIADQMAMGQVVRVPGLFVAGAYVYRRRDGRRDVFPRFQATPPLNRTVAESCRPDRAANVALDNHRKGARRQGVQHVREVTQRVRSAIVNQDLRALRVVEAIWRDESPAHAI